MDVGLMNTAQIRTLIVSLPRPRNVFSSFSLLLAATQNEVSRRPQFHLLVLLLVVIKQETDPATTNGGGLATFHESSDTTRIKRTHVCGDDTNCRRTKINIRVYRLYLYRFHVSH